MDDGRDKRSVAMGRDKQCVFCRWWEPNTWETRGTSPVEARCFRSPVLPLRRPYEWCACWVPIPRPHADYDKGYAERGSSHDAMDRPA